MNKDTKSLIKHTLLGLLGGGAISALYAASEDAEDKKEEQKYQEGVGKNQIVVPLSRKHYLKALGTQSQTPRKKEEPKRNVGTLGPMELAALKRSILREKAAEAPVSIKSKTSPSSSLSKLRKNTSSMQLKGKDGKFASSSDFGKQASDGFLSGTAGTIADGLGTAVGMTTGLLAVKALANKIAINRKKRQIEKARREYANLINKEVNDDDEPYYSKSAQDRSLMSQATGILGLTGIATASLSGLLIYKIMENRRKAAESAADKDTARFPTGKTIKFKFV